MGWDDNGLPTERRVQNYYGVRCDPSLPYDPAFEPPTASRRAAGGRLPSQLRRAVRAPDRRGRAGLRRAVAAARAVGGLGAHPTPPSATGPAGRPSGASCGSWPAARPTSTRRRPCGTSTSSTAVAQAELEDRETARRLPPVRRAFRRDAGGGADPSRSRPPGPSCSRPAWPWSSTPTTSGTAPLFGTEVVTPLFGVRVPVVAHPLADPEKGSGIAMICTFGDTTDVVWWRELDLPTRAVVGRDGRLLPVTWGGRAGSRTTRRRRRPRYDELVGPHRPPGPDPRSCELLAEAASLVGEPRPITHPVKFYETGRASARDRLQSRQWFVDGTLAPPRPPAPAGRPSSAGTRALHGPPLPSTGWRV